MNSSSSASFSDNSARLRLIIGGIGFYAFTGGLSTFIGWAADIRRLTDWVNSGISMMPNMAVALMFAGSALVLKSFGHHKLAAGVGLVTGLIGAATLFEHITNIDLGIDSLLVSRPWGQRGTIATGRIGPPGSASLTILGLAFLLSTFGRKGRQAAIVGGMLVACITLLSITGYLCGVDAFYALPKLTVIAFQTATFLLALTVGFMMCLPDLQPMKMLCENSAAAALVRRALPIIILLPLMVGWLRLQGQNVGWYDVKFGVALRTVIEVVLLVGLLWWAAKTVKTHETGLRESEERFRALAENIPQLAWMTAADGGIFWYNQRWYNYTGTTLDQMRGWRWQMVHHPEHVEHVVRSWKHALETGEPWEDTFPLRGKDGEFRWFLSRAFPIRDAQGKITNWFGTNTDVTELREAQAELAAASEVISSRAKLLETLVAERTATLSETNEQLEAFVYSISHDLRGPLRSMQGFSQILMDDHHAALDDAAKNYLGRINHSAEFMDKLIIDLLAFGRTARAEISFETVDVGKIWEKALFQCATQIEKTKAQIEARPPFLQVHAHDATLTQVLANLLSNALKFVAPGVTPNIQFWAEENGGAVRIWVQDNGLGIPKEHLERVFRVFERLHGSSYSGTGIGLSIVRKGVERMNGKVGLESELGKGSRFWIELPKG